MGPIYETLNHRFISGQLRNATNLYAPIENRHGCLKRIMRMPTFIFLTSPEIKEIVNTEPSENSRLI